MAHTLSGLAITLEAVKAEWTTAPASAETGLGRAIDATRAGLTETRRALKALRAAPLEDDGLIAALTELTKSAAKRCGAKTNIDLPADMSPISPEMEQTLFRVARESLRDAASHAAPTAIGMVLSRMDEAIVLTVTDNGQGFDKTAIGDEQFGLTGMKERAVAVGGLLTIDTAVGRGTTIRLTVPQTPRRRRNMIGVLICDDQEMIREGLLAILNQADTIEIVGTVDNGAAAVDAVEKLASNLVLMDLEMPVMNGAIATRKIKRDHPHIHVPVLTTYDADEWAYDAIRAGASGYILKDSSKEPLIRTIEQTAAGDTPMSSAIAAKLYKHVAKERPTGRLATLDADLTEREKQILHHQANGRSNQKIAKKLFLSEGMIRNYLSVIFEKLEVDRTQAAVLAVNCGFGGDEFTR